MTIQEFIVNQVFQPRLDQRVLVVYDPEQRFRELCLGMADPHLHVVDASESSIESREQALETLAGFGQGGDKMLVYIPASAPITDEEKQRDPFSAYSACGAFFPDGDGDSYMNLCLKAKPDQQIEVRKAFEQDEIPDFTIINNIGGGKQWPTLRALLKVESSPEIIIALMVPEDWQRPQLENSEAWVTEAKQLFQQVLGLKLTTRSNKWKTISEELWRYVLFSEFVSDFPAELPDALATVPCAPVTAQPTIDNLCNGLRQDLRKQDDYIQHAEQIERDLNLETVCKEVVDFGTRDTFPIEERTFLHTAIKTVETGELDQLKAILSRHTESIWVNRGENETQWGLVAAAKDLIETCGDLLRLLPDHSNNQETLVEFYLSDLRKADRLQREFEQAVSEYWDEEGLLKPVIHKARDHYRQLSEKVQQRFTKQLADTGWPPQGRLYNADVFDTVVAPKLETSGQRVAYLMVDALRYELGA